MTKNMNEQRWAMLIFISSLIIYSITMAKEAYPALSAELLAGHLHLTPFPPLFNPIWGFLVRIIGTVFGKFAIPVINFSNVLFASVSLAMLYLLIFKASRLHIIKQNERERIVEKANHFSGMVAVGVLAFCPPFWFIATRAHPGAFDVFILLSLLLFLVNIWFDPSVKKMLLFSLLWGIGITEFSTMIILAPVVGAVLLIIMWRSDVLKLSTFLLCVLLGLLGLTIYLLQAWQFTLSPAYDWRNFDSFFKVIWFIWRDQYVLLARTIAPVGWILILFVSLLPWMILTLMPLRHPGGRVLYSSYFLFVVLSGIALLLLFNVKPAPWQLTGIRPLLFIPYVFIAVWLGYLAGLWYYLFLDETKGVNGFKRMGRPVYAGLITVLVLSAGVRNFKIIDPRPGNQFHYLAKTMVENLDGRDWVVSDGVFDNNLNIAATQQSIPLRLINPNLAYADSYRKYLASLFDDMRLQHLAKIGLAPFLEEWFAEDTAVTGEVAGVLSADQWVINGYYPYPYRGLIRGSQSAAELADDSSFLEDNLFNGEHAKAFQNVSPQNILYPWCQMAGRHLSKLENNRGIVLEDLDEPDLAYAAYQNAREIDTNNISAMLNQLSLAVNQDRPERQELQDEFEVFANNLDAKLGVWALSRFFGYVKNPGVYVNRGMAWALSGKPRLAIGEMSKAIEMTGGNPRMQNALAGFYVQAQMEEKGRETYLAVLDENPDDMTALLGMTRLSIMQNELIAAKDYLNRVKALGGGDLAAVLMQEAVLESMQGNPEQAIKLLKQITDASPDNLQAWHATALMASAIDNEELLTQALDTMRTKAGTSPATAYAFAQIQMQNENYPKAREYLEESLRRYPNDKRTLETVLRIDVMGSRKNKAEEHVEQLLRLDPRHPYANYVQATLLYNEGKYALAEQYLRVSLAGKRDPYALNDLAWLLLQRGQYDEAAKLIKESLSYENRNPNTWDTYAMVLLKQGNLPEAEEAMSMALAQTPNNPAFILHMGMIYAEKGLPDKALEMTEPLLNRLAELPVDVREEIRDFIAKLRVAN